MIHRKYHDERIKLEFVEKAREAFENDDKLLTFSYGDIVPGSFFAVKWGLGDDCILILTISENTEPEVFGNLLTRKPI